MREGADDHPPKNEMRSPSAPGSIRKSYATDILNFTAKSWISSLTPSMTELCGPRKGFSFANGLGNPMNLEAPPLGVIRPLYASVDLDRGLALSLLLL